jgi:DNA polymerase I
MWIFDVSSSAGGVELWTKDDGAVRSVHVEIPSSFYFSLPDPHAHGLLLNELECRYGARECNFTTIYGVREGFGVYAGRKVAEAIERQTKYAAQLYNVDVRAEQRHFAASNQFPCGYPGEKRLSADFPVPLEVLEIRVRGKPHRDTDLSCVEVRGERTEELRGNDRQILGELFALIKAYDPEVILFPHADYWTHIVMEKSLEHGIAETFSRNGTLREMGSKSYWSYGRREYRAAAVIPEGRILIDTEQSFVYREGGLTGVLLASRITGLAPNLTARFTPGTLVSGYEVFEALKRGIAIPFRKREPERLRNCTELRSADRGGMMFQPKPGLYGRTWQLDFTSLYPTIIVKYNLSPETLEAPHKQGFLAGALEPLLSFRIETKRLKKTDTSYAGIDKVLKWMLVTCFGYTGYRNAKFGRIEMHERITAISREILLDSKELAEEMGFDVLHGIVDCIWVQGGGVSTEVLKERIEKMAGIPTECEAYEWLVFLPQSDGSGAYNRYYGRLNDGSIKVRGIAARRKDSPPYISKMQHDLLAVMGEAETPHELRSLEGHVQDLYHEYRKNLACAATHDLIIQRRISRLAYAHRCIEGAAVQAFRERGIEIAPGMKIGYVVRDARRWIVDPEWDVKAFDRGYYQGLLEKAWEEISFAFQSTVPLTDKDRTT